MNTPITNLILRCLLLALALSLSPIDALHAQAVQPPNKVLRLDGDGDYVHLPSHIFNDLEEATVEAWVKWGDFSYYSQWFAFGSGAEFRAMGLNHSLWLSTLQFFIYDRQRQAHIVSVPTNLPRDTWCHMAAVSGRGGMRFYINGVLVGSDAFQGSFAAIGSGEYNYLGKSHWEENIDFLGELDEVRVWGVARSQAQIRASMHQRLRGTESGLKALWNFDGTCASEVIDSGPGGHTGRLLGDAYCAEAALPKSAAPPALLTGQITDAAGRALAYAKVNLASDGRWITYGNSDAEGQYQIQVFGSGPYDVVARRGELGRWRQNLHFVAGREYRADVVLTPSLDLYGQVRALDDKPLVNVLVQALRQSEDGSVQVVQTVHSDERGTYRFFNLRPDTYYLRAHRRDRYVYAGGTASIAETKAFVVDIDHRPQRADFRFAPTEAGTWRIYDAFKGLAADEIRAITQSTDGLLWVASAGAGLWSFDGEEFTHYTTAQGLADNEVSALSAAADGGLWIGGRSGISHFADGVFTHYTHEQGLVDDTINTLYMEGDGGLWIGTANGISHWVDGAFVVLPFGKAMRDKNIKAILRDRRGALWMASDDQGLWRYADGQLESFSFREGLANFRTWALHEARDGMLWIGTDNGLSRYDGAAFTNYFSIRDDVANHRFRAIGESRDGTLYFATFGGGVLRLDGEHFTNLTQRDGLANDEVLALYADAEGALWFGGKGGLSRYDPRSVAHFDRAHGLEAGRVRALAATGDNRIWLGLEKGLMSYDGQSFARPGIKESIDSPIDAMEAWGDTLLFASSDAQGGWLYADGTLKLATEAAYMGSPASSLAAVYRDRRDQLWFGTQTGVLHYGDDGLELFFESHGLVGNFIVAIGQDQGGDMFFADESKGISRYDGTNFTSYTTADGLPSNLVRAIYTTSDGRLFFGSYGGLSHWDGAHFFNYNTGDGLAHNRVEAIAEDAHGRLWLATYGGGISIYDGTAWSALDTRDGLTDNNVNALAIDGDQQVWLGTEKGLVRYRPDAIPPRVRIVSAQTDSVYMSPETIEAFAADTRVTIRYRAIDFKTRPEKRQYRYRVIGLDDDWRVPTRENHFEWTPTQAGDYTFEVQAIDRDLNYSAPARLELHVVLPWYGNPWIVLPGGGAFLALVVLAGFSSTRYYRTRRQAQVLRDRMLEQERAVRLTLEESNAQLSAAYEQMQEAQQQAEKAADEARAANQAKSAFLANMSHELRTPLNAILGFAQLLERSTQLKSSEHENLGIIRRSGEHLLALINDVLEMSRIEAGRTVLEETAFDLCEMLDSLSDMFRLRAEDKGLMLRCEKTAELPCYVRMDEGKLRQILINLLGNAIKFTPQGEVVLRAQWDAGRLIIAVTDTGAGIASAEQAQLFDAFVQTQSGRRAQAGTGLGLAISQQFAQLMGGQISVSSQVDQGSTFRLDLPVALTEAAEVPEVQRTARRVVALAPGQPQYRVLIVEDGEDNRRLLRQVLEPLGFQVREAIDGQQGVEQWREWRPQLVWMDMRMPVLDGYEATRQIRTIPGNENTKIIALTASAFEEDRQKVLHAGCDDFVCKPFREEELFAKMHEHLGLVYVYEDEGEGETAQSKLTREALAVLPAAWRHAVYEAAEVANEEAIEAQLAALGEEHTGLAQALRTMVHDFRFDEIMALTAP